MFVRDEDIPTLSAPDQNHLPESIVLTGNDLTVEQLVRVARMGAKVAVSSDAVRRIEASRATVNRSIARGDVVYGLNTELGPLADKKIHLDALEAFQRKTVVGHSVAHGEQLETPVVRAMILTRINGMAKGGAGVRLHIVESLCRLLNCGVHPIVRWDGSTGQSDLSEMAQIAGVLIGVGEAEYRGMRMCAEEALKLAGLSAVELQAKEGLGLISANGLTLGLGSLVLTDARLVLRGFDIAAALALEGFGANLSIIHPAASRMKPHPGHKRVSERLRMMLQGSYLHTLVQRRHIQDPLSFRCIPQVHGACADAMEQVRSILEMELNSASDNPLVSSEDDMMISVGNFDVTNIAVALDMLRIALVHVIQIASERVQKQLWSHFSGLPTGLGSIDDPLALLIPLSRVCAAIAAEATLAAAPVSLSYRSQVAEGIEDHASLAPYAVLKTYQLIKLAQKALAIEMIVAAKAIDMRKVAPLGTGTQAAYDLVASPQLNATTWKLQIERVVALIYSDRFLDIVSEAVGGLEAEPSHSDTQIGFYI